MDKKFNLSSEEGKSVNIPINANKEQKKRLLNDLIKDAKDKLSPGTIFEIRQNLNKSGLAWYYKPDLPIEPFLKRTVDEGDLYHWAGYYLIARLRV